MTLSLRSLTYAHAVCLRTVTFLLFFLTVCSRGRSSASKVSPISSLFCTLCCFSLSILTPHFLNHLQHRQRKIGMIFSVIMNANKNYNIPKWDFMYTFSVYSIETMTSLHLLSWKAPPPLVFLRLILARALQ